MPKEQDLQTIKRIATQLSSFFKFPGFDRDDILQEATLIGISVFSKFDDSKGKLDDFLFMSMRNGLYNLKVKHYHNPKTKSKYSETRKNIVELKSTQTDGEYSHPFDDVEIQEISELVDRYIHPHLKKDYTKIKEGIYIGTVRREKILGEVQKIYKAIMEDRVDDLETKFQSR